MTKDDGFVRSFNHENQGPKVKKAHSKYGYALA